MAVALMLLSAPRAIFAQQAEWREQRTANFAILFPAGAEAEAAEYAQFVDGVYDEVSAVFSYRPPTPVILRIYPTMELYYQANPLAAQLPGVVAHAHTGRREISVALPQTAAQSPDQIVNNVRHEFTHIIAADLSDDKLTTAFQEGIAQYIEHPSPELDLKMQLMQQVIANDRLLTWRELNQPGAAYADPQVGYPQSYTMVAFLIGRNGLATFRTFLEQAKTSSGYRSAIEAAYSVSADQLEQEWRAQLDQFIVSGYLNRGVGAFDLSQAEALIARGEYEQAAKELEASLQTLEQGDQTPLVEQTKQLLQRANDGQRAVTLAAEAKTALEQGDYKAAKQAAQEGRNLMNALGQAPQMQVMDQYSQLAEEGLAAHQEVVQANGELRTLHVGAARNRLAAAYQTFTRLGDERGAALVQSTLGSIQRTISFGAIGLVVLSAAVLGWNVHRRIDERGKGIPFS